MSDPNETLQQARGHRSRFPDRAVRLRRQEESRVFDRLLMPAGRLIGLAGLAGLVVFGCEIIFFDAEVVAGFRASVGALAVPLVLLIVRFVRGHFSPDLREP